MINGHPVVPLRNLTGCRGCIAHTPAHPRPLGCGDLPNCDSVVWARATPENLATYVAEKLEEPHGT